jgi:hypothetical protein
MLKVPYRYSWPVMDRPELAALLETGVSMLGASADPDLRSEAFRVWGASLDENGPLRVLVSSDAGRTLANVRQGSRLCFTFTDIVTFQSVQAKGRATGAAEPPGPADIELLRRYDDVFVSRLLEIGHPTRLGDRLRPVAVFVVSVEIDDLFDQTPGPGAGARMEGSV